MDRLPAEFQTGVCEGSLIHGAGWALKIAVTRADAGLSAVLRGRVVRRVLLSLSRFGPRIRKVTVRLSEPINPLGGVDHRCRMRAWLQHSDGIHVEAINGGFEAAVARAARLLAKRVDLALDGGDGDGACPPPGLGNRVAHRPDAFIQARAARRHPPRRSRRGVNPARGGRR